MIENWMVMPIRHKNRVRKIKKVPIRKVQPAGKTKDSRWNLNIYV